MQLRLYFHIPDKLILPLSYHHILQGFIYNVLSAEPDYSSFLHDYGYKDGEKPFKLFVFSLIDGKYEINKNTRHITFYDKISFEVRSPMYEFCDLFCLSIMHRDRYIINDREIFLDGCVYTKRTVMEDSITVRTLSPICLTDNSSTDSDMKTHYISPIESCFCDAVNNNFISKYRAAHGYNPEGNIIITPEKISDKDKYVTRFLRSGKSIFITAWNGLYNLSGSPTDLSFLYDCGIGSRNSQGFGMIEKI